MKATVTDTDVANRLERELLAMFWLLVRDGSDRLDVLLDFTRVAIVRPSTWNQEAVRDAHQTNQGLPSTVRLERRWCFACQGSGQLYAHHVIEIQHGGSNAIRNQVPLCFDCHQYLHPWLTDDDRIGGRSHAGFESLHAIIERAATLTEDGQ